MTKYSNQKSKLLYLMQILQEETDENHPVSRKTLEEKLANAGIHTERKSLYHDIETLKRFGMDIIYRSEKPEGYYIGARDFELAELKLLVDVVQSSRFITEKKSNELIRKIERLTSRYEATQLQRQVYVSNRIKAMNESIYYNVDDIHEAIASNEQIQFQYTQWTMKKELRMKKNGGVYTVSPWALTWDSDNYYLIGLDMDEGRKKHFRVDKMHRIRRTGQPRRGMDQFDHFDLAQYAKQTFGMFGGEEKRVKIRFESKFAGVVIDRFGKSVSMIPNEEEGYFTAIVDVVVSNQFFGWLTGLGEGVRILSPQSVVDEYKALLTTLTDVYDEDDQGEDK